MALYPSQCTIVIYEDFHVSELALTLPDVEQLPATCAAFSSNCERQLLYRGGPLPKMSMSYFPRLDTTFTSPLHEECFTYSPAITKTSGK